MLMVTRLNVFGGYIDKSLLILAWITVQSVRWQVNLQDRIMIVRPAYEIIAL